MGRIVDYNLTEELAHGTYVSCLVRDLAKELGLDEAEVYELTLAGLLHDIGKLKLTDYLRGETCFVSPLVIEEMKYVRMHSMLSYDILRELGYSDYICTVVRYHHENYDGSGYPDNLAGERIPYGSRIIRVCDVFAALTTDRPYRKSFSMDEAMALMIGEIDHFDMRVFLAFQRVIHRVGTSYQVVFPESDIELLTEVPEIRALMREAAENEDLAAALFHVDESGAVNIGDNTAGILRRVMAQVSGKEGDKET